MSKSNRQIAANLVETIESQAKRYLSGFDDEQENSNYEGSEDNYEGDETQHGYDFGRQASFVAEKKIDRSFQVQIQNKDTNDKVIAINPAYFLSVAEMVAYGFPVDGILADGNLIPGAAAGVQTVATAMRAGLQVNPFLRFANRNPTRCIAMVIEADDQSYFEVTWEVKQASPFKKLGDDKTILLTDYFKTDQYRDKKIEVDLLANGQDFQFDDQNVVLAPIPAGRTIKVTFKFGGINNQASKFETRAKNAHKTFSARTVQVKGRR